MAGKERKKAQANKKMSEKRKGGGGWVYMGGWVGGCVVRERELRIKENGALHQKSTDLNVFLFSIPGLDDRDKIASIFTHILSAVEYLFC